MHFRPTRFDDAARELLLLPVRAAGVVAAAACQPVYVEAVLWQRGNDRLLVLNNHSGTPLPAVTVDLRGVGPVKTARSQQGVAVAVTPGAAADHVRLALPVRLYDFVFLQ